MKNTICIVHLKSDVDNVLYDMVLGGRRKKSLPFHNVKLPTHKNKKPCPKIHRLSKKSEQVARMK